MGGWVIGSLVGRWMMNVNYTVQFTSFPFALDDSGGTPMASLFIAKCVFGEITL